MNLEKELQSYSNEVQSSFMNIGQQLQEGLSTSNEKCFNNAGNSSEKYVSCMMDVTKRFMKEQTRLELRTTFFQMKLGECLTHSNNNSDAVKKCKQEASTNLKNCFNDFVNVLKK